MVGEILDLLEQQKPSHQSDRQGGPAALLAEALQRLFQVIPWQAIGELIEFLPRIEQLLEALLEKIAGFLAHAA